MRWRDRLVNALITVVEYMLWLHYPWDLLWWAIGRYKPAQGYIRFIFWLERQRIIEEKLEAGSNTDL